MKLIATTIAVTTFSLAILLVIVGIDGKSGSHTFQSANAQVSVFPGTQPEKPSTGTTGGTTGGTTVELDLLDLMPRPFLTQITYRLMPTLRI